MSLIQIILIYLILGAFAFLMALSRTYFFQKRGYFYASNSKRAMALILDLLLFNLILGIFSIVYFYTNHDIRVQAGKYVNDMVNHGRFLYFLADLMVIQVYIIGFYCVYAAILESTKLKGSLGTHFMDLQVTSIDGSQPNILQTFLRGVLKFFSIMGWPVFFMFSLISKRRQWPHDMLTKTAVKSV